MYILEIAFATPEFDEAVRLRTDVLRKPLGLVFAPEQLAAEYKQRHLGVYDNHGQLLGCLTMVPVDQQTWKMRQVAVAEAAQGRGLGKILVGYSEALARSEGIRLITLHARETAVPFYLKLGYQVVGDRFEEVGIAHFQMEKAIAS